MPMPSGKTFNGNARLFLCIKKKFTNPCRSSFSVEASGRFRLLNTKDRVRKIGIWHFTNISGCFTLMTSSFTSITSSFNLITSSFTSITSSSASINFFSAKFRLQQPDGGGWEVFPF
eukprot:GHVT01070884.1.p2 GENE.GHVT01070884.1~~GHVT01070884.1.p2  ORF type:complete len:117 (+),score=16.34 GHVT01070884.1:68-418(+)